VSWFGRGGDPAAEGHQPTEPTYPDPDSVGGRPVGGQPVVPGHSSYCEYEVDQYARLSTTPMPYDVESTHEPVIVLATAVEPLRQGGPTPGAVLSEVLQELGQQASRRGCDGVWSIQHTMTVDAGVLFVSAMGTGSRPVTNLDEASPGSRA
jgi:hypothetical protein